MARVSRRVKQSLQFSVTLAEMLAAVVEQMDASKAQVALCLSETSRMGKVLESRANECLKEVQESRRDSEQLADSVRVENEKSIFRPLELTTSIMQESRRDS